LSRNNRGQTVPEQNDATQREDEQLQEQEGEYENIEGTITSELAFDPDNPKDLVIDEESIRREFKDAEDQCTGDRLRHHGRTSFAVGDHVMKDHWRIKSKCNTVLDIK
jgi:hypothetical protein